MLYRMYATAKFDREIDPDKHYISPGGYEVKFKDGRSLQFDFDTFEAWIDRQQKDVLHWVQKNPDDDSFPDIPKFSYSDFAEQLQGFEEFFIYTGEYDDPEIIPVQILSVRIEFEENDKILSYEVPENLLPEFPQEQIQTPTPDPEK